MDTNNKNSGDLNHDNNKIIDYDDISLKSNESYINTDIYPSIENKFKIMKYQINKKVSKIENKTNIIESNINKLKNEYINLNLNINYIISKQTEILNKLDSLLQSYNNYKNNNKNNNKKFQMNNVNISRCDNNNNNNLSDS